MSAGDLARSLDGRNAEDWIDWAQSEFVERLSREEMHGGIWKVGPLTDWSWHDMFHYVQHTFQ